MFTPSDKPALLLQWLKRARESQHSHHDTARLLRRLDRVLGLLVVLLTAFLMFGLVAAIEMKADQMPVIRIAFIAISAIATFIGIAQSAMSPSDRARAHESLGAKYGAIRREIELLLTTEADIAKIDAVRKQLDDIGEVGPVVPLWIHNKTIRRIEKS